MTTATTIRSTLTRPIPGDQLPLSNPGRSKLPRWAAFLLISGLYLTLRGYHAFDGDQAYRLPLLHHRLNPALYATDPFVQSLDQFNPHRGYLTLLAWASRPFGQATGLLGLFALTLAATTYGIDRLARSTWPDLGGKVGLAGVSLVLLAKGGNIGTNHLFESTLLDRLIGFALGWLALAWAVDSPRRGVGIGALCLGLATLIHPSVGLQLSLTLATAWGLWGVCSRISGIGRGRAILAISALGLALVPGMILASRQAGSLFQGLPSAEFRLLAVMIQGPQHMLPSTWRLPQWLAWGCYPTLALLALSQASRPWPRPRVRLVLLLGVNLVSLLLAYVAVEVVGDLRVTVFQPFRMATLARGLSLVAISGRLVTLWDRGDLISRGRAVLIAVGLTGDWMMVVATSVELALATSERLVQGKSCRLARWALPVVGIASLVVGLGFLARHDTESGHGTLMGGLGGLVVGTFVVRRLGLSWSTRRVRLAVGLAWAVPASALVVGLVVPDPGGSSWSAGLVERCRFAEIPTDDLERLAVWCREHTPAESRFIGPPGPKTFRLWSRRSMAFNRAGSPYHAEGLNDWSRRFRDHVRFQGSTTEFARAYLADRHALEAAYGRMTDAELALLARQQGADHVLTASNRPDPDPAGPLVRLRAEGRYAVYRLAQDK